jgi:hypothetical protein
LPQQLEKTGETENAGGGRPQKKAKCPPIKKIGEPEPAGEAACRRRSLMAIRENWLAGMKIISWNRSREIFGIQARRPA